MMMIYMNEVRHEATELSAQSCHCEQLKNTIPILRTILVSFQQTPKLPSINLNATPARSILKSGAVASVRKSGKKSIKTVLFNESDSELNESVLVPEKVSPETNVDSGVSSMDVDKESEHVDKENKNSRRRSKLTRQEATEDSPVMTRSRRKSVQTPKEDEHERPRRAGRQKKVLQESEPNATEEKSEPTPKKSSRRKKSVPEEEVVAKVRIF